ncbi:MAG: tRNA uridine-5-carboxymethylaminomethyl(34) synthesis GTPase MnmE [Acidobacteria bacterium]|nr:tRNA uridine-5-carboxymethylaminomethyl(34) synthesis GTPase MnmE [Acidobacteriota bacterium]
METIVALATPPGRSAIALVRVSGPDAMAHLKMLTRRDHFIPRRATLVELADPQSGDKIDTCLAQYFPAPHSYTGEDLCEISCHGSPVVSGHLIESFLRLGDRLAQPGEFTLRAFMNGKMDLAQAEALRDLVAARTEYQVRVARAQLGGKLSRALQPLKRQLVEVISLLETAVEFVEDDVGEISRGAQAERLNVICGKLEKMEASYQFGRFVHDGFQLAIMGRPNVGKSSLFNALLESDRAIVTEIPGTTRDAITESTHIHGIPVRLTDTAGIRRSADRVEQIGMERSHQAAGAADILLVVLDASEPATAEDEALLEKLEAQYGIVVQNKMDLIDDAYKREGPAGRGRGMEDRPEIAEQAPEMVPQWQRPASERNRTDGGRLDTIEVSALTGKGIEELRQAICSALSHNVPLGQEGIVITNLRHRDCMTRTRKALEEGIAALRESLSEEFALYHIRHGLQILGEITGETTVEDILDKIFSTFCIGK